MSEHLQDHHGHGHDHAHGHGHDHGHSHRPSTTALRSRSLLWALGANAILLLALVVFGLAFGSLAVLADAVHQFSDVLGLVVAVIAFRLAQRASTAEYTFGLRRAEVLGGLLNAVLLVGSSVWIFTEAFDRLGDAPEINGPGVVVVAIVGLFINTASAIWLHRVAGENLNLRAAAAHLGFDAAGSAGVLVAGIAAVRAQAYWVDSAMSLVIAILVLVAGGRLIAQTGRVLLEGSPPGFDLDAARSSLLAHPSVEDVHHLHVWSIDSEQTALSAHVVVTSDTLHDAQVVSADLESRLASKHRVAHSTLALECHPCDDELSC